MSYKIILTPTFEKEFKRLLKKYPSIKLDIFELGKSLQDNPIQGSEVFKNCYKIRLAIKSKGKGKSGGGRVITFVKITEESVYLLSIYDKSDKETVTDTYLKQLLLDIKE
ncbi:type II toxin-antitoxin system RelE/ParE family toxin [Siphonobacter sp. SORGH_AS_1065]|uniref:type II toxin-antitoxin system RelE family toxin n=1 Tax=Siphonobacter sp. SORGH_AS_1065 TaxID=3041795 RepID=UPI0027895387|nr:type II toxin-antitoxin system RelE/ParE family toxin [Siphonobacter sp. SORGH_AS_1065]MDQ1086942.1 mRNA-degrading endonuclease RelE of RelBE toxin-antitoxin system [Siphonobacter sp. SORGH_AS_1065]